MDERRRPKERVDDHQPNKSDSRSHATRLSDLKGLGKEIWQGEDAQAYVNWLREECDAPETSKR